MNDEILHQQINDLINGSINEAAHQELQQRLKSDAAARTVFRERMDLEASLRTWAANGLIDEQPAVNRVPRPERPKRFWSRWKVTLLAAAASILAIAVWRAQQPGPAQRELAEQQRQPNPQESTQTAMLLGRLVQQANCIWEQAPSLQEDRFRTGMIKLVSGAAELRFDSGTNVILEGPCELSVETVDTARLLAGNIFVDVTDVSNGFLLETSESQIIDEGTQYAVSLDSEAVEVHVFDGSVIWTPTRSDAEFEERIPSGEARRYLRSEPARSHHIPFGQRQFVRRIEESVREAGGGNLLAYDGFENLAGQLRRGRSGFGWAGGWVSAGRGRGPLAEVIDAPDDVVFGVDRSGRRLLSLRGGDDLRRSFESPIELSSGTSIYLSLLVSRPSPAGEEDTAIQVFLEPESASPRFTRRHTVSLGVRSDGQPFVNNAGTIDITAVPLSDGEAHLFVFKLEAQQNTTKASLRVFRTGEFVDATQPSAWTVHGTASPGPTEFTSIRISLGTQASVQVDELRIANSWSAAVNMAN
jgi:ferric-dicitrate binding protein FerR (iron transport regulator)